MQAVSPTLPKSNTKLAAAIKIYGRHYERYRKGGSRSYTDFRQGIIQSIAAEMKVDKTHAATFYQSARVKLGLHRVDQMKQLPPFSKLLDGKVSGTIVREETKKKVLTGLAPAVPLKQPIGKDPYSTLKAAVLAAFAEHEKVTHAKAQATG